MRGMENKIIMRRLVRNEDGYSKRVLVMHRCLKMRVRVSGLQKYCIALPPTQMKPSLGRVKRRAVGAIRLCILHVHVESPSLSGLQHPCCVKVQSCMLI